MSLKHLLVHLDVSPRASERLDLAITVARRHGARLTGLFAESGQAGPGIADKREPTTLAADEARARTAFEEKTRAAGLATDWWRVPGTDFSEVVGWTVVCCRYADLAFFGQHQEDGERTPGEMIEAVLHESGRPLVVVPGVGRYPDIGSRVLVAWTGSRESARALNDAMPFLVGATDVEVLSLQRPGTGVEGSVPPVDVVAHLAAHGVKARYERLVLDEMKVVDHVLNRASDRAADLTVIGGYTHRGFPYLQRSSTTHDILRTMTTPVLLSR
jgi:nucleotide-binding universal stress UspA family protein